MAISTLTIDIEARMATLQKDLDRVVQLSEQTSKRMEGAFKGAGAALGGIFAGIGVAGVVAGFRNITDQLDALNDAADATGASVENLSALEDIGKRTGASFESVQSTLIKFNQALNASDGNNGAANALKAIGLNAEELKRLDPAEALRKTAVALSGFADDGNKARLVQELFGKSIREAAPFLKDLAEQGRLNATATGDQAAQAEKFNKQLFAIESNVSAAARSIVSEMLPALNRLSEKFRDEGFLSLFGFDKRYTQLSGLSDKAKELRAAKAEFDRVSGVGISGAIYTGQVTEERRARDLAAATERLKKAKYDFNAADMQFQNDENERRLGPLMSAYVSRYQQPTPKIGAFEPDPKTTITTKPTVARVDDSFERYMADLTRQIEGYKELSAVEKAVADIEAGRVKNLDAAKAGQLFDAAQQIDAIKERERATQELIDGFYKQAEATKEAESAAERLFTASLTPSEELARTLKEIQDLYEKGAFLSDEWATAEEKRARAIEEANKRHDKQVEKLNELEGGAKDFAEALKDAALRGGDLLKAIEAIVLKKLVFDPLSKEIDKLFEPAKKDGGGTSGGSALDLIGSIGNFFGGFFADGGNPPVGKWSIVGERGPELIKPRSATTVIPNNALGGQAINITNNVTVSGDGVTMAQVQQALAQSEARTKGAILQSRNRAGVFE